MRRLVVVGWDRGSPHATHSPTVDQQRLEGRERPGGDRDRREEGNFPCVTTSVGQDDATDVSPRLLFGHRLRREVYVVPTQLEIYLPETR